MKISNHLLRSLTLCLLCYYAMSDQFVDNNGQDHSAVHNGQAIHQGSKDLIASGAKEVNLQILKFVKSPTALPSPGPGPAGCTGASMSLAADQCAAWGKFWDGAGGPNWGGKGQNCSKSDPCACRYGVECSGGSITTISLFNSGLRGTISNAVGAFVDMRSFNVAGGNLTGSLPASMSAWKKLTFFSVRDCKFNTTLPVLNYRAMTHCDLCSVGEATQRCGTGFSDNIFSCPFPPGVTDRCSKFDGDMSYEPITVADCHNTTAARRTDRKTKRTD